MFEKMRVIAMEKERERKQSLQLEEMTDLYINETIFDSTIDDWKENTTEFDKKIMHRRKLIFLIEDTEANIFGCYIDTQITIDGYEHLKDNKCFVFSFDSKSKQIIKYDVVDSNNAFKVYKSNDTKLMTIGWYHIVIMKKDILMNSKYDINGNSFNFKR